MAAEALAFRAWLVAGATRFEIEGHYASKYSLWVRLPECACVQDGARFDRLEIECSRGSYTMGPCLLQHEQNAEGHTGRLILMGDLHDLESLFFGGRVDRLDGALVNLPLLLAYKSDIDPAFRDFVADLSYDLNVWRNLLDRIDLQYQGEPERVRETIQSSILESHGRMLMHTLDDRQLELERLVSGFARQQSERHGYYFRRQLWNIILVSPIMSRTNLKPRGYGGDSEMMRMIYENRYEGDSSFARIMHKHPVEQPGAQAVRNRRGDVARLLHDRLERAGDEHVRVLSVACGPAFEVEQIVRGTKDAERLRFTMFDQDQYALLEAARVVGRVEESLGVRISVDYLRESVRTMLAAHHLDQRWGQFDFLYSMGLFDYLTPPVAEATLVRLYGLLRPGGEIVIGNFNSCNFSRRYMEYWLDWAIYYRSEEEMRGLAKRLHAEEVEVTYDATGIQMLLRCKKPA